MRLLTVSVVLSILAAAPVLAAHAAALAVVLPVGAAAAALVDVALAAQVAAVE